MDLTSSFLRSVYDCPQPTNMTGDADMYTIDSAAPTYTKLTNSSEKSDIRAYFRMLK